MGSAELASLCLQDPSALEEVATYQNEQEESYQEQVRLAAEQRKAVLGTLAERIAQGRAKKRRQEEGGERQPLLCGKYFALFGSAPGSCRR